MAKDLVTQDAVNRLRGIGFVNKEIITAFIKSAVIVVVGGGVGVAFLPTWAVAAFTQTYGAIPAVNALIRFSIGAGGLLFGIFAYTVANKMISYYRSEVDAGHQKVHRAFYDEKTDTWRL